MSEKAGTSKGAFAYRRVRRSILDDTNKSALLPNADRFGRCIGTGEVVRTYKRRNMTESKPICFFERQSLGGLTSKSNESRMKGGEDYLCNRGSINACLNDSSRQCRTFVLQHMLQSLKSDDDGIKRCIRDAQMVTESDNDKGNRQNSLHTVPTSRGIDFAGSHRFISDGDLGTECLAVSETCGRAFFKVIQSEKFTQLCRLLFENFQGIKTERLLDMSIIDRRMKAGAYEHSPLLFSSDIQQLWVELQKIGNELVTLSTGLLDFSRICLNEQMGRLIHTPTPNDVNREFCARRSDCLTRADHAETCNEHQELTCRQCGGKVETRDGLVCDWCEEMYHVTCIDPATTDAPAPCNWLCSSCKATGCGTEFHENCIVCARLNASRIHSKRIRASNLFAAGESTVIDIEGSPSFNDKLSKNGSMCKFCEMEVGRSDKMKICEHLSCPFKYFHVRCLTENQLKSHGPHWYCPSCLCRICLTDKDDDKIVLCDCCDKAYHIYCLNPPLAAIPRGKWSCKQCDADLHIIRSIRNACQVLELKHNLGKMTGGGMDMLLSAALKCEKGLQTSNHMKTQKG